MLTSLAASEIDVKTVVWLDDRIATDHFDYIANLCFNRLVAHPASTVGVFLKLVRQLRPEAVIVDLGLDTQNDDGANLLGILRDRYPQMAIIVYSGKLPAAGPHTENGIVWLRKDVGHMPQTADVETVLVKAVRDAIENHKVSPIASQGPEDAEGWKPTWVRLGWFRDIALARVATSLGSISLLIDTVTTSKSEEGLSITSPALLQYGLPAAGYLIFVLAYLFFCPRLLLGSKDHSDYVQRMHVRYENDAVIKARVDDTLQGTADETLDVPYNRLVAAYHILNNKNPLARYTAAILFVSASFYLAYLFVNAIQTALGAA